MIEESSYEEWLKDRRSAEPSSELTGRVMALVDSTAKARQLVRPTRQLQASLPAQIAACAAGLLIGSLPFLFVAYLAQSPLF